ncbi:MAG: hypothetical protein F4X82_03440, partial [Candidatus Spechtbacteria bacterium SB0662_bin_43]|nr:hypothetical protein [Candidatus Spechtbacteria bacterium SB0662_bin_43]
MKKDKPLLPKVKQQADTNTFYLIFFSIKVEEQEKYAVYTKKGFIEVSDLEMNQDKIDELEQKSGLDFVYLIFQASTIEIDDLSDDFANLFVKDNSKKNI